jgi:hypothetical protein
LKIPEFIVSKKSITEDILGTINRNKTNIDVDFLLKNEKHEVIELNYQPFDILVLNDTQILIYGSSELRLYDQNMNLIKEIKNINGKHMSYKSRIAFNSDEERFYILDSDRNKVLITDLEFNLIKTVGSYGNGNDEFNLPYDFSFKNGFIYVADNQNKRVQMFNSDLVFVNSLTLEYRPMFIKCSNTMACITTETTSYRGVYFYNLENLSLCKKFDHDAGRISEINSRFYEFNFQYNKFYCFDENGDLKEEINLKTINKDNFRRRDDGGLVIFNQSIWMNSYGEQKLVKFSKL